MHARERGRDAAPLAGAGILERDDMAKRGCGGFYNILAAASAMKSLGCRLSVHRAANSSSAQLSKTRRTCVGAARKSPSARNASGESSIISLRFRVNALMVRSHYKPNRAPLRSSFLRCCITLSQAADAGGGRTDACLRDLLKDTERPRGGIAHSPPVCSCKEPRRAGRGRGGKRARRPVLAATRNRGAFSSVFIHVTALLGAGGSAG